MTSMSETLVQMVPMLVLAGLIAAWLAEAGVRAGGYGFIPDTLLGLTGSMIAGAVVWGVTSRDPAMTTMLLAGGVGAGLAIVAQRGLWRSARHATYASEGTLMNVAATRVSGVSAAAPARGSAF